VLIKRNITVEDFITKSIQDKLISKPRTGLHLSDLLNPKQSYWQKKKPIPPLKKEIVYWLSGKAHESIFLNVSNFNRGHTEEWNGIYFSPDAYLLIDNKVSLPIPIDDLVEMKTMRRGFKVKEGEEAEKYKGYLKQLRYYCAIKDKMDGGLFTWYLTMMDENRRNSEPDYFYYTVTFTEPELRESRQEIMDMKKLYTEALERDYPDILPDCEVYFCYKEKKNMIEKPYCKTCNKDFSTDWGIDKHINSRTGKDKTGKPHEIVKAKYETVREPRCKYSKWCKPELYNAYQEWYQKNKYVPLEMEGMEEEDAG